MQWAIRAVLLKTAANSSANYVENRGQKTTTVPQNREVVSRKKPPPAYCPSVICQYSLTCVYCMTAFPYFIPFFSFCSSVSLLAQLPTICLVLA